MPDGNVALVLFGISTCDTCKVALKSLQRAGRSVVFRDVRAEPLAEAEIAEIVREFGDRVVNRQSTTWRGFNDFLKAADPEAQIAAQPSVMKRPVIRDGDRWHLGWDEQIESALVERGQG